MSTVLDSPPPSPPSPTPAERRRQRLKLLLILAVCAAPVIASYFVYYVVRPEGRTNYGDLVDPQRAVREQGGQALGIAQADGTLAPAVGDGRLATFAGHWLMVAVATGPCDAACAQRLWVVRQVRLTSGKDQDRVERLLLLSRGAPLPPAAVLAEHPGLHVVRAGGDLDWLPLPAAGGSAPADHLYIVDPHGNLMMRFPRDADPNKMKKDLARLLRASRIG